MINTIRKHSKSKEKLRKRQKKVKTDFKEKQTQHTWIKTHWRWHAETLGGMSSSCRSQELRSSLSRGGARRDRGGGGGVSEVGSEFCRGMGGREGEGNAEEEDTPWGSYRDWEPDKP